MRITSFLLKVCLIICLSFIALELAVRYIGIAPPLTTQYSYYVRDDVLPFKPKPLSRLKGGSLSGEFHFVHEHNSLGFRDVEHSSEKHNNAYRIMAIGDSFTYGVGAMYEDTYLAQLEKLLTKNSPSQNFEIIKAGIPRYFPEAERILLDKFGPTFSPDLVLAALTFNDVAETQLGIDAVTPDSRYGFLKSKEAEMLGAFGTEAFKLSHIFRILWGNYVTAKLWEGPHLSPQGFTPEHLSNFNTQWQTVAAEYDKMLHRSQSFGAKLVTLYIPSKRIDSKLDEELASRLSRWSEERGVPFVDSRKELRAAAAEQPVYWGQDAHCNAAGYAAIAEALAPVIQEQYRN